jgi:integrase
MAGAGTIRRRGRIWWIRYCVGGKRHEQSSHSTKRQDAVDLLRTQGGLIARGVRVTPKIGRLTFEDAAADLITDYETEDHRSIKVARRRITKHLTPYFRFARMADITTADVQAYRAHRQKQGILNKKGERIGDVSNAELNRELALLKRMFSLAIESEKLIHRPSIKMSAEPSARAGFFEPEQFWSVVGHLPAEIQPIIEFAYITGWRINSEVLPLEWGRVNFDRGEVRLDKSKNGEPRVITMGDDLRALLERQHAEHELLKKAGHIIPWVFWRMVAEERRGKKLPRRITTFAGAWKLACRAAGCPGKIPHDLRRTAVRNMVRRGIPERVAMKLTGHKTRSVFERYNIVSTGDLQSAAKLLDGLLSGHGTRMGQSGASEPVPAPLAKSAM